MSRKELIELNKKFNSRVHSELFKFWGPRYLRDWVESVPRMAIGTAAMNLDMFKEGFWNSISSEELGAHMMMSMMMTKGRGHWGRDKVIFEKYGAQTNQAYMAAYGPYKRALAMTGASAKKITDNLNMHEGYEIADIASEGFNNSKIGQEIIRAIEGVVTNEKFDGKLVDLKSNIDISEYRDIVKLLSVYNVAMKRKILILRC